MVTMDDSGSQVTFRFKLMIQRVDARPSRATSFIPLLETPVCRSLATYKRPDSWQPYHKLSSHPV